MGEAPSGAAPEEVSLSVGVKRAALALVAALTLGSAAQASEINITIRSGDGGLISGCSATGIVVVRSSSGVTTAAVGTGMSTGTCTSTAAALCPSITAGANRCMAALAGGDHDDCRLIIKRSVDRWGDLVVKRIKVCG